MRFSTSILSASLMFSSALPALAVSVRECDWASNAQSIAEPWEKNTKVFGNGAVRIAAVDTGGEPVCCSMQLLILAEDKTNEQGERMCRLIGSNATLGFEWIDFSKLTANYHPARGLLLTFPYSLYVDGLQHRSGVARVNINTARGIITAQ
jgi:hypothetical protein